MVAMAADLGAAPSDVADAWREVEAHRRPGGTHHRRTGGDWIDDLNAVVFGELGYEREIESGDVRFFRLSSVIAGRRGSCVGLGALYLVLGERLGVGLDGVMVPGHFFVRSRGGSGAATSSCSGAARRCPRSGTARSTVRGRRTRDEYLRPLTVVGDGGGALVQRRQPSARGARPPNGAALAYARAVAEFPTFAEAQASLGAVRQLEGALDEAEAAYGDAARARADLPGLATTSRCSTRT